MFHILVQCDGACATHKKPRVGGYGAYIQVYHNQKLQQVISLWGPVDESRVTNNRAELLGALKALAYIDYHLKPERDTHTVMFESDSTYVVRGVSGLNKRVQNLDLFEQIDKLNRCHYDWQWIPRNLNKVADALSRRGQTVSSDCVSVV